MNPLGKGIATSEGQLTVAALIGAIAAALAPLATVVQVVAILTAGIVAVAYILSRTRVKTTAVQTSGVVRIPATEPAPAKRRPAGSDG